MKLVQKILSHGLLIAFFIAVFFLYLYRQSLFPQWFGAESQSVAEQTESSGQQAAVTAAPEQAADEMQSGSSEDAATTGAVSPEGGGLPPLVADTAPATDDALPPMADETPSADAPAPDVGSWSAAGDALPPTVDAADSPGVSPAAPQYRPESEPETPEPPDGSAQQDAGAAAAAPDIAAPATGAQPARDEAGAAGGWAPAPEATAAAEAAPQYRPLEPPRSDAPAADSTASTALPASPPSVPPLALASPPPADTAPGAGVADDSFRARLAQAREIFWQRDMRGALRAYSDLVKSYPSQADGWGELGNLYLTLGQRSAAADAYYEAIALLIDHRETLRARHMLRVLFGLDPDKASELEQRLRQISS